MSLSDYEKVGRVVSDGSFITRVRAAVTAKTLDAGTNVGDDGTRFLMPVASTLAPVYTGAITADDPEAIDTEVIAAVAALTDADIDNAVDTVWTAVVGAVVTHSGQEKRAMLARNQGFQDRVYQIVAAKANGVVAAEAQTPGSQNAIAWAFAVRLQAGLYLTPAFKLDFACNVAAVVTDPDNITDAELSTKIDSLLTLFVAGRTKLEADGKTLADVLPG